MPRDYPDRPIVGVGVVLWRDQRVLLIRRGNPPRLGQWSLPGGAQQLGETVTEAAQRELFEETGLAADSLELLTTVDLIERDEVGRVRYHYTLVDFTGEAGAGDGRPGDDAAAVGWFTRDEIDALGLWTETRRIIDLAAAQRRRASGRET
ncbi:MAG TPA: NUDIX hydrolase [Geminicoccaceae bacterium]|nr:NUDIX hydrolase [Geminicoccaceae bacterium]